MPRTTKPNLPAHMPAPQALLSDKRECQKDALVELLFRGVSPAKAVLVLMVQENLQLDEAEELYQEILAEANDKENIQVHDILYQNLLGTTAHMFRHYANKALQPTKEDDLPTARALQDKTANESARTAVQLSQELTRLMSLKNDKMAGKKKIELEVTGSEENAKKVRQLLGLDPVEVIAEEVDEEDG